MIEFEIDISDAIADLARIKNALQDMGPALKEAGLYMERETKLNIARGAGPSGPFAPLAASTLRRKRSGRILQETGAMVNSIAARGPFGNTVRVGPTVDYAIFHQFGTRKMAARPFLGIEARHEQPIVDIVERHIRGAIS